MFIRSIGCRDGYPRHCPCMPRLLIAVKLMHSVDHRHDILYRGAALHDVDGVEDVAAVGREDLQTLEHLPAHLFRRAERQDLLGVDAAAPSTAPG